MHTQAASSIAWGMKINSYFAFEKLCEGLNPVYIGTSALGYPIPMFRKPGTPKVLIVGGVHAREATTVLLTLKLFRESRGELGIDCIPLLNPDGVVLSEGGLENLTLTAKKRARLLEINGSSDFSNWKANINAVDLNVNCDADWGKGRQNVTYPAPANYIGSAPFSEPETRAVREVLKNPYDCVLCYHARGEEIYYGFKGVAHYPIAEALGEYLNYRPLMTPYSAGGIKDYWIQETGKAGFTLEVGADDSDYHDLSEKNLNTLWEKHKNSLEYLRNLLEDDRYRLHDISPRGSK